MCETFIRIGLSNAVTHEQVFKMIRTEVFQTIRQLEKDGIIDWYSFLIHDRESGDIPTTIDDNNLYFHIRVSLSENNDLESLKKPLKDFCLMTRKAKLGSIDHISLNETGTIRFNPSLFEHEGIEEVWRILGEQSEFFLKVFDCYKDNAVIPTHEILAFLHYYHNMVGLAVQCPKCGTVLL
jgi:hypothetical protein